MAGPKLYYLITTHGVFFLLQTRLIVLVYKLSVFCVAFKNASTASVNVLLTVTRSEVTMTCRLKD